MGFKDAIEKAVDDIKDTFNEGKHRGAADAEQTKRDLAGDEMSGGEQVRSVANQAKETVQADYDATKRDLRDAP